MSNQFTCWQCAQPLTDVILPMSRREECGACRADQHVCKKCVFFDGSRSCNEERAEHVADFERANFCDYFKPSTKVFQSSKKSSSDKAKAELAALFGDEVEPEAPTENELSPAELAEKKLRDMLNG